MAVTLLLYLPTGSAVFIDANIFVYAFDGKSRECQKLLDRCVREEVVGISLFEVVNEVTHALMLGEARSKGLIPAGGARALREKFHVIPQLTDYWKYTERILSMNLVLLASDDTLLRAADAERRSAGLLTNDSMIAGCMRKYGITLLATSDLDFERVQGIKVYRPADLP